LPPPSGRPRFEVVRSGPAAFEKFSAAQPAIVRDQVEMASGVWNKVFMAVLTAVLIAMLTGFISNQLVHPHRLAKNVMEVPVEAPAAAGPAEAAPAAPEPVAPLLASADVAHGQTVAKQCAACHTFEQGGPNKVGPNLWEVVNRKQGGHEGFSYSAAISGKGGNWDYEALNHFLTKPSAYAPGTKMTFAGLKKLQDRADVIAYLRTLAASPAPLP
jgi:cytochrome c